MVVFTAKVSDQNHLCRFFSNSTSLSPKIGLIWGLIELTGTESGGFRFLKPKKEESFFSSSLRLVLENTCLSSPYNPHFLFCSLSGIREWLVGSRGGEHSKWLPQKFRF